MQVHLSCSRCPCHFTADADAPAEDVLAQMTDDAPWFALAEGDTFGEMVLAALQKRGRIFCPDCRAEVVVGGPGLPDVPAPKPRSHDLA